MKEIVNKAYYFRILFTRLLKDEKKQKGTTQITRRIRGTFWLVFKKKKKLNLCVVDLNTKGSELMNSTWGRFFPGSGNG